MTKGSTTPGVNPGGRENVRLPRTGRAVVGRGRLLSVVESDPLTPSRVQIEPRPLVIYAKSRRLCASCMKRKSKWIFKFGEFLTVRVCFACMTPEMTQGVLDYFGAFA